MAYSPAFQFYPRDYLGDRNTIPMTTEENGAYCLLMWFCWENDGLPDDMEELADDARLPVEKFTPMWNKRIKKCFVWDEKRERYFHPRLLKEIKKQRSWKKKKSDAGKQGAASRWNERSKDDGGVMAVPSSAMAQDASSSSSSSASPSSRKKKAATTTDVEWIQSLKTNPAYKRIDVDTEVAKARIWAETNRRQCTRRFVVNWLNRSTPIETNGHRPVDDLPDGEMLYAN